MGVKLRPGELLRKTFQVIANIVILKEQRITIIQFIVYHLMKNIAASTVVKFLGFRAKVKKGDIFWVRETFGIDFLSSMGTQYCYRANKLDSRPADGWKPSIFMPKDACRIFLEVTNERVERLRDISEKDAKSEGIAACPFAPGYKHYTEPSKFLPYKDKDSAGTSFFSLWMSINGAASLDANPFVFVYDFKIVDRPNNFLNNN